MKLTIKDLMQLCFNAGWDASDEVSFSSWWEEYGKDRHTEIQETIGEEVAAEMSEASDIIKGLFSSLETVIEVANNRGRAELAPAKMMVWGRRAQEFLLGKEVKPKGACGAEMPAQIRMMLGGREKVLCQLEGGHTGEHRNGSNNMAWS